MSIVIYGPQGCGKTRHAERLRQFYKLERVIEQLSPESPPDIWASLSNLEQAAQMKAKNALYITDEAPPEQLQGNRRVIAFEDAMRTVEQRQGVKA